MSKGLSSLVAILFFYGTASSSFDFKDLGLVNMESAKAKIKTFLETEDIHIGAKIGYASVGCKAYGEYVQSVLTQDAKRSEVSWQEFQKYKKAYDQTATPCATYAFSGMFGYWLYNRIAYPSQKKNWGVAKRSIAKAVIFTWLFKAPLLAAFVSGQKKPLDECLEANTVNLENENSLTE